MKDKKCLIIAHRGASAYVDGNTLAAFKLAISQGADGLEMDVRKTLDDKLIVIHNKRVKKGWRRQQVSSLTLAQLKKLTGVELLPLEDVFSHFKDKVIYDLDVKEPGFERQLTFLLKKYNLYKDKVLINSNKIKVLEAIRKLLPQTPLVLSYVFFDGLDISKRRWLISLAALVSSGVKRVLPGRFKKKAVKHNFFGVSLPFTLIYKGLVDYFHRHKIKVYAWPPNNEKQMRKLISLGVDGIKTGRVDILASLLKSSRSLL